MIFQVDQKARTMKGYKSSWQPKELDLEQYLLSRAEEELPMLNSSVFGEPLLLISNQIVTGYRKRADIFALDQYGNSVIIELKRGQGSLGVDTQALQYLSDFSQFKGKRFIDKFSKHCPLLEEYIKGFIGDDIEIDQINKNSRIILMARSFDPTLYSMGEWLSEKGIPFRCIEYTPIEHQNEYFLSFSVVFDRSSNAIYPLSFQSSLRCPGYFWHNIGNTEKAWWDYLVKTNQISTSFDCQPGDQGEKILKKYIKGDCILAYAKKYGFVGYGIIEDPNSYKLIEAGSSDDILNGYHLHRLSINWKATVPLEKAISPSVMQEEFGIIHPRSTSVSINGEKAKKLIEYLSKGTSI